MMEQFATAYAYYRGGTSKAAIVKRSDLPPMRSDLDLDAWVLAVMGSPDRRQIDGLGGADPLTSKFAIVGPPTRPGADVDYTFLQVIPERATVTQDINCGNISAAIGPFAIDEGLVASRGPITSVRIHATNMGQIIHADVEVGEDGKARVLGSQRIDGVPGTGAPVRLDFRELAGGATGRLLPTGRVRDRLIVDGKEIEVSIVDLANLVCYVRAADLGLAGTEDPLAMQANYELMQLCERVRLEAALLAGVAKDMESATRQPPSTPWLALVSAPRPWRDHATGEQHEAHECDIGARLYARGGNVHKAYPGTGSACLGVASMLEGSVAYDLVSADAHASGTIRIGHPCGVLDVAAAIENQAGADPLVRRAAFVRTARRIADGRVYTAVDRLPWLSDSAAR
ncbi:2-methylaconitate cis-trans-isomerase PrpF [Variovorax paradoxus]|jgi:2-methylaconitate cis-trans-isomerase PrpF|nr:2-methylaconitate cis-trans-isomerase PrpF [Variovorax paradoxus]